MGDGAVRNVRAPSANPLTGAEGPVGPAATNEAGASLLPDPGPQALSLTGDPGAMLAALVVKSAREQRKVSSEMRQKEEQAQEREEQGEIASMHAEANRIRDEGWVKGGAEMAAGGLTLGSGATEHGSAALSRGLKAGATAAGAVGDSASGQLKGAAKDEEKEAKQHELAAGHAKRGVESATDDMSEIVHIACAAVNGTG